MRPEDNPADDHEITKEEWEAYDRDPSMLSKMTLAEADATRLQQIRNQSVQTCPRCDGTGRYRRYGEEASDCSLCDGTGKME